MSEAIILFALQEESIYKAEVYLKTLIVLDESCRSRSGYWTEITLNGSREFWLKGQERTQTLRVRMRIGDYRPEQKVQCSWAEWLEGSWEPDTETR